MPDKLKLLLLFVLVITAGESFAQVNPDHLNSGLTAIAFDDVGFERPFDVKQIEVLNSTELDFPAKNNWALQCKGLFQAPITGEVTIYVETDNYVMVEMDGEKRFEANQDTQKRSFTIGMEKGSYYPVEIFYVHDGGQTYMHFSWSWEGSEKSDIPASALSHTAADRLNFKKSFDKRVESNREVYLKVPNPDPGTIPSLDVWERRDETLVGIEFPGIPGLICDAWCYESEVDLVDMISLDGGRLKLLHRFRSYPHVYLVTLVTPRPGEVEFIAWIEKKRNSEEPLPDKVFTPNLCWQLKRADNFSSKSESYPDFIKRCFMITGEGPEFLDKTDRKPIPVRDESELENNPPWVQNYLRDDQPEPVFNADAWAGTSDSRYSKSIIGAVSKDGKYLTAIANNAAITMCQAWHDCMHNNPLWLPADVPVDRQIWRLKIYGMENDMEKLVKKVEADFPENSMGSGEVEKMKASISGGADYQTIGSIQYLPIFSGKAKERQTFPMSWLSGGFSDFDSWKMETRRAVRDLWQTLPEDVSFNPVVIDQEDRGDYIAQKIVMNITSDSRILTYLLKPKGEGPFPAVLLLHDHGAKFDIGKEKVIRPFSESEERMQSAIRWTEELYDGNFIGDELAKRGYVCFAIDALNWGDRYGGGQMAQQAIACNMLHMGMSFAGLMAHEDCRSAEYLASLDFVDPDRISAAGLSMGAYRTWQVSAMSDHIQAGMAICWMATSKGLMSYSNNQTKGHSSYSMLHPGIFQFLDFPDMASLACPNPMLFYNGSLDKLFPVPSVEDAYGKMQEVWRSRDAEENLVTELWLAGHVFSQPMQHEAFLWLDRLMKQGK